MQQKIEILAPAGSFASLNAAINAGADAVYLGVGQLNMRASSASNFDIEELNEISKLAHTNNIKVYVTINNIVYDNEKQKIYSIIDKVKEANIDAIIAADITTIIYARSKNVEVHISTQISISNIEAVKYYSKFSDRIVLARELNLEQIKKICDEIKKQDIRGPRGDLIEIEVFTHGALCVAVSGRCGMSLYSTNKSANRGQCSQICRRQFKVTDIITGKEMKLDNNYLMSSADLCTIGMLPELLNTGISVLKFEGRGRSPEYVTTVITTYKEAIQSVYDDTYDKSKIDKWNKNLGTVFNKGFTTNFFRGRTIAEWAGVHGSKATEVKVHIGKVVRYYPNLKVVEILIQAKDTFEIGEKYSIVGNKTGAVIDILDEIWLDEKIVKTAHQGDKITFKVKSKVREGDMFYALRPNKSTVSRGKEGFVKS